MTNKERDEKIRELLEQIPLTWDNGPLIKKLQQALKSSLDATKNMAIQKAQDYLNNYE